MCTFVYLLYIIYNNPIIVFCIKSTVLKFFIHLVFIIQDYLMQKSIKSNANLMLMIVIICIDKLDIVFHIFICA